MFGLVATANRVKIICDEQVGQEEGLGLGNLLILSLFNLNRAFTRLPVTGNPIDDLMRALSAGAGLV